MNAPAANVIFAALNIDCADPAALAEFWGKALGRPVSPGAVAGDMAVDATDPDKGPRLIFHPVSDPEAVTNRLRPILLTDQHDEETERLAGLGAKLLNEISNPAIRHSTLADPEGNDFDLVTWQSK
ncbi:MAG TPA: VOC family protein [Trebonia sp.]|nr:VOC family protein [Trebonia sp.]